MDENKNDALNIFNGPLPTESESTPVVEQPTVEEDEVVTVIEEEPVFEFTLESPLNV